MRSVVLLSGGIDSTVCLWMTKAQVIAEARRLLVPLSACSSCYLGTDCGKCAACVTTSVAMEVK
jgi:7-cyano-7-deazaguanine synthase in queuosine biosynthesis